MTLLCEQPASWGGLGIAQWGEEAIDFRPAMAPREVPRQARTITAPAMAYALVNERASSGWAQVHYTQTKSKRDVVVDREVKALRDECQFSPMMVAISPSDMAASWVDEISRISGRAEAMRKIWLDAVAFWHSAPDQPKLKAQVALVEALGHIYANGAIPVSRVDVDHSAFYLDWRGGDEEVTSLAVSEDGDVSVETANSDGREAVCLEYRQLGRLSREFAKLGLLRREIGGGEAAAWVVKLKASVVSQRELLGVLQEVNGLLVQEDFEAISKGIMSVDRSFNTTAAVAILRLSSPAKERIGAWAEFKRKVHLKIDESGRNPAKVLRGL